MRADKKQILVCGNYGAGNLGDEAILDGLLRLIDTTWPGAHVTVLSSSPASTRAMHQVKANYLFPAGFKSCLKYWVTGRSFATFSALRKADLVILGGGGLFSDEKWQAVWIWFVQSWWFWLFRKKMVCLAQSVGPLKTKFGRTLTRIVFRRAIFVSVRDKKSAKTLRDLGIIDVKVLGDAAFALSYDHEMARNRKEQVVLSMRKWEGGNSSDIALEIAKTVDWLWEKHELKTLFISFQEQGENDSAQFEIIKSLCKNPQNLELKEVEDYQQAIEIIGRSRLVLGMRLHSLIFATLGSTPFVGISYSTKVKDLLEDLGMAQYCLNYYDLKFTDLQPLVNSVLAKEHELCNKLTAEKMRNAYLFFEHEKALKELL